MDWLVWLIYIFSLLSMKRKVYFCLRVNRQPVSIKVWRKPKLKLMVNIFLHLFFLGYLSSKKLASMCIFWPYLFAWVFIDNSKEASRPDRQFIEDACRLSTYCTARGFTTCFSLVGTTKVKATKSVQFTEKLSCIEKNKEYLNNFVITRDFLSDCIIC